MDKFLRKVLIALFVIAALLLAGYAGYMLYNYAVEVATQRIKKGVTEGVAEGIGEGIGDVINPLELPKKLFGGK